jgi:nucleoside-diphosphate-sugar epimerase
MRILVTGGSGYLGSSLVTLLVQSGHNVIILDKFFMKDISSIAQESKVNFIQGDILDLHLVNNATRDIDAVFHLAAVLPTQPRKADEYFRVNYFATKNLLEACRNNHVQRFIYASSQAVFGFPEKLPANMTTLREPIDNYGLSKFLAESACKAFSNDLILSVFRSPTILGKNRNGIFDKLFWLVKLGLPIPILGSGANFIQTIHVDDLANAMIRALVINNSDTYHIGSMELNSLQILLEHLISFAKSKSKLLFFDFPKLMSFTQRLARMNMIPVTEYQMKLTSTSFFYDNTDWIKLGMIPKFNNFENISSSYFSYLKNELF